MSAARRSKLAALAALAVLGAGSTSAFAQQAPADSSAASLQPQTVLNLPGNAFFPMNPTRVLDTRDGTGGVVGPIGPGQSFSLTLAGSNGIPANATGVALNVTTAYATAVSFVTVWPTGQPMPTASALNPAPGVIAPNGVASQLGGGQVSMFNAAGQIHLVADVVGYYAPVSVPVNPVYAAVSAGPITVPSTGLNQASNTTSPYHVIATFAAPSSVTDFFIDYSVDVTLEPGGSAHCLLTSNISELGVAPNSDGYASNFGTSAARVTIAGQTAVTINPTQPLVVRCRFTRPASTTGGGGTLHGAAGVAQHATVNHISG